MKEDPGTWLSPFTTRYVLVTHSDKALRGLARLLLGFAATHEAIPMPTPLIMIVERRVQRGALHV